MLSEHTRLEVAEAVRRGRPLERNEPVPGCACVACLTLAAGGTWEDVEEATDAVAVLAGLPPSERITTTERWSTERERGGRSIALPSPGVLAALAAREPGAVREYEPIHEREPLDVDGARRVGIVEVARRLGLVPPEGPKRVGRELLVSCPFHRDRHPSLRLNPERDVWHCFPCGEGGDALDLYMRAAGLDFVEAVKELT